MHVSHHLSVVSNVRATCSSALNVTCILHPVSFLHVAAFFWELIHPLHTTANTDNNSQHCLLTICWELLHPFARRYNNMVKWFLINLCSHSLILNLFFGILHSCIHHFYPHSPSYANSLNKRRLSYKKQIQSLHYTVFTWYQHMVTISMSWYTNMAPHDIDIRSKDTEKSY